MGPEKLAGEISEYCKSANRDIHLTQSLSAIGGEKGASEGTTKEIDNLRDRICTELRTSTSSKPPAERAYNVCTDYLNKKDKNPDVAAVFEGIQLALFREAQKVNPNLKNDKLARLDQQFQELHQAVDDLKSNVNRTLNARNDDKTENNKAFVEKERTKVHEVLSKSEGIIDKHKQFGTESTLAQAKKEVKQELNSYHNSVKVSSFFNSIKEAFASAIDKISKIGLNPFAKQAMEKKAEKIDVSTTLRNLEGDVKVAKSDIEPVRPKR